MPVILVSATNRKENSKWQKFAKFNGARHISFFYAVCIARSFRLTGLELVVGTNLCQLMSAFSAPV